MITRNKITTFDGRYRFLSNLFPVCVNLDGMKFESVEHAYQAAKTLDIDCRQNLSVHDLGNGYEVSALSAAQAKKYGRKLPLRPDWEQVKIPVMLDLLRQKFSTEVKHLLLATGDACLEEGNHPHNAKCKSCVLTRHYEWRKENPSKVRESGRRCDARRLAEKREYNAGRVQQSTEAIHRYRERYPEKYAAHKIVIVAVRQGKLVRKPCEACSSPRSHAHHDDYSKPLDVRWLCSTHHRHHHRKDNDHETGRV